MMTMTIDDTATAIDQSLLSERVLLLCPQIGYWKGHYKLLKTKTTVTSGDIVAGSDDITTPQVTLMTKKYPMWTAKTSWQERFMTIEGRLSNIKEKYSLPFSVRGARIVPKVRGAEMLDQIYGTTYSMAVRALERGELSQTAYERMVAHHREQMPGERLIDSTPLYREGADVQSVAYDMLLASYQFRSNWPTIRQQIADSNSLFREVEKRVPDVMPASHFYVTVTPIELAGGNMQSVTASELAEHAGTVRESCQRCVDEAMEEMIRGPREELAKAIEKLSAVINNQTARSASFNAVTAAIDKIKMFSFVATPTLLEQVAALQQQVSRTNVSTLNQSARARSALSDAIAGVSSELAATEEAVEFFRNRGYARRSLDLDDN